MKPFKLDRDRAKRDLRVIEQELRNIKSEIRPRRGPTFVRSYLRNGHAVLQMRRELLSYGKSMTAAQGQRLHQLKYQATLICTMLASVRSAKRFARSAIGRLRHPESMLDLATCVRFYTAHEEPQAMTTQVHGEVEPATQSVHVLAVGVQ
jgi:hypothetical protein